MTVRNVLPKNIGYGDKEIRYFREWLEQRGKQYLKRHRSTTARTAIIRRDVKEAPYGVLDCSGRGETSKCKQSISRRNRRRDRQADWQVIAGSEYIGAWPYGDLQPDMLQDLGCGGGTLIKI